MFVLNGRVRIGDSLIDGEAKLALLDSAGETISLLVETGSRLLVLNGQPIGEPVASYGPFVMNTEDELMTAISDYRAGRMGHLSTTGPL